MLRIDYFAWLDFLVGVAFGGICVAIAMRCNAIGAFCVGLQSFGKASP
ncbi:hypothetical protein D554_1747 [Bordetella holmesii 30539]|uniref:N-acetyltransferase YedL n=1 Tax=Bordetella holmesii 1058 TaxID=1247648 RepID=A0ABN0RUV6_9BORD|nr:hypothetical protein D560_2305 [Bordetella holmesii ATCC 51541]AIT26943.1 hypothetical protein D558_2282 [Bordetella holmesii 44057]EWM42215.1 hypothetical protein D556_2292 [Bordetella holmesii 41130]EWM47528.1 hypothetical protein D555_2319 [Bordetella holmesii 35009]EWM51694.1 hypothetical protein D557_1556 [Bordetella holmesii 70147]EXF88927.1 hypothetical protein D554_1747 [Bordetella holmesii 30539]EXX93009.1 hypothetical protein D559_0396 [Bordetella holmesii 1058]